MRLARLPLSALAAAYGCPGGVAEYRFAPPRRFAFDLCWVEARVALEQEGGMFGIGKPCPVCKRRRVAGHSSVERIKDDIEKYNLAALLGWKLIRALPQQVDSGEAFGWVRQALEGT